METTQTFPSGQLGKQRGAAVRGVLLSCRKERGTDRCRRADEPGEPHTE